MAKYLQIQIEDPCQQRWEDMQATTAGNFCNNCQKTVIDFTGMTDNQLMEYFLKHPSGVCGRVYTDQLDTAFKIPAKGIPWLKYFFQVTIPAMLLSYKAGAQRLINKQTETVVVTAKQLNKTATPVKAPGLSGSITGSNGEPVAYASVMVSGTNIGTTADSNGLFFLRLPGIVRTLEISAVGYEKKEIVSAGYHIDVKLNVKTMENVILTAGKDRYHGKVMIGGMTSGISIRNRWDEEKADMKKTPIQTSIEIFPNPIKRDGVLTIRWKKEVVSNQQLVIYNASGAKIFEQTLTVKQPLLQTQLQLHLNAAGYYVVGITEVKSQKKETLKLVVK